MDNEIDVIGKLLHLGMVAIETAVLDGQRMKPKDVEENVIIRLRRVLHVDPDDRLLIFEQCRQLIQRESFLNPN
jgi:hypothetical protein